MLFLYVDRGTFAASATENWAGGRTSGSTLPVDGANRVTSYALVDTAARATTRRLRGAMAQKLEGSSAV